LPVPQHEYLRELLHVGVPDFAAGAA
jgi:hypothetical protein